KGLIDIDASDKKSTVLTRKYQDTSAMTPDEASMNSLLFKRGHSLKLGEKYNAGFTSAYESFRKRISGNYGKDYFRWNLGYTFVAGILTILAVAFAIWQAVNWTGWHTLVVLAFAAINALFMYLMPAPTQKGEEIRS